MLFYFYIQSVLNFFYHIVILMMKFIPHPAGTQKVDLEIADHVDKDAGEKPAMSEALKFGGVRKLNTGYYDLEM